ncbi:Uncharacterised protein [Mycobacterium tuberculosis]|nr:Uncharacterised protein [Mycobacterium tuberculosis]CNU20552.1 Uncharacterised protein [Mycobacterium tuberculosis]
MLPSARPRYDAIAPWAASSTTARLWCVAIFMIASISQATPA